VVKVVRRQVFEAAAPVPPRVVEYQVVTRRCAGCGKRTRGQAPAGVVAPVQWGPGVAARGVLATVAHHLPYGRAAVLLKQLAGVAVSVGFLVAVRGRAAVLAEPFMVWVRQLLARAGLLHVDETPARVDGSLAYVHVACNDSYTAMHTGGRSAADIDAGGVLPDFAGVLVRDGYAGYTHLVAAAHAWCGAHYAELWIMPMLRVSVLVAGGGRAGGVGIIRGFEEGQEVVGWSVQAGLRG
jgi:transposase